jgi:hypothetical protein
MLAATAVGTLVVGGVIGGAVALPQLLGPLQDSGEVVSRSPRVLSTIESGTVIAYLSIQRESGQPERDLLCVAAVEADRRAQSQVVSDSHCVERSVFESEGLSTTLFGLSGDYDVGWGPTGRPHLDVLISEEQ